MTRAIDSLLDVAGDYDAIVLDQWGVLHDGTTPYPGAVTALEALQAHGLRLAVLSNSGKRALPNAARIAGMGFDKGLFEVVMTSGEALWQDIANGRIAYKRLCAITRDEGDAEVWAKGLDLIMTASPDAADAVLLMGLPDDDSPDSDPNGAYAILDTTRCIGTPMLCTNPDRASPRAGGVTVTSPGALAHEYAQAGGEVAFYGKPHAAVFRAVELALGIQQGRLLMVGDSLEHDIAGGHSAGWDTAFIRGGLHASAFAGSADVLATIAELARADDAPMPTFTLDQLG